MHMWPLGSILVFWPFAYGLLMVSMNTYQQNSLRSLCVDSIIYAIAATILHSQACIYNDICDQRLDGKVERTKDRPLVSGRVSLDGAWFLLIALVLAGLYVLSFISYRAVWWTAVDLLTLNAIYPFMKRYTWWPSLFLGMALSFTIELDSHTNEGFAHEWGILVSWLSASGPTDMRPLYLMYAGLVCWTVYYDSIYACQDRTDDVKAGIKSTALLFGPRVKPAVRMFAVAFVGLMTLAGVLNVQWRIGGYHLARATLGLFVETQSFPVEPDILTSPSFPKSITAENSLHKAFTTRLSAVAMKGDAVVHLLPSFLPYQRKQDPTAPMSSLRRGFRAWIKCGVISPVVGLPNPPAELETELHHKPASSIATISLNAGREEGALPRFCMIVYLSIILAVDAISATTPKYCARRSQRGYRSERHTGCGPCLPLFAKYRIQAPRRQQTTLDTPVGIQLIPLARRPAEDPVYGRLRTRLLAIGTLNLKSHATSVINFNTGHAVPSELGAPSVVFPPRRSFFRPRATNAAMFHDITIPMSGLLVAWCTSLLYAAYMRILFGRGLKTTVNRILFTIAVVQFSFATAQVGICLQEAIEGLLYAPNPILYYADQNTPVHIAQLTLKVTNTLIADGVLAWRLYVVWSRNLWLTLPVIAIIITTAVCGYVDVIILTGLNTEQQLFSTTVQRWAIAAWSTSIGAEMSATLLIAWKLWFTYTGSVGAHRRQHLKSVSVMLVILESGAVLSSMQVFLLSFYVRKINVGAVIIAMIGQLDTLIPTSIFVRLASKTESDRSDPHVTSSRLRSWTSSSRGRHQHTTTTITAGPFEHTIPKDDEVYELQEKRSIRLIFDVAVIVFRCAYTKKEGVVVRQPSIVGAAQKVEVLGVPTIINGALGYHFSGGGSQTMTMLRYSMIVGFMQKPTDWVQNLHNRMAAAKSPASELRALADLINGAVAQIEAACASRSKTFPSSDEPFTLESEAARMSPDVLLPGNIIVAAAQQLISAVRVPALTLLHTANTSFFSACLRLAISVHVSEILREAGPQGLHVKEIAAKTKVSSAKLARALRLLATNHIFREVSPDVFTNNRLSSLMDTRKPVATILAEPDNKFDGTSGIAAILEHITDEGLKASGWLAETIMDPEIGPSEEANETALNKAFNTPLAMFPWFELPENGFDWKGLPKGSVVVDVGGGTGHHSLVVAQAFENVEVVVQDREAVIPDAVKHWEANFPEAVKTGRVKFQGHDFFKPQPVKEPAVFMLRLILHDWADKYSLMILKQLRAAAGPHTQLLIMDHTLQYACEDSTSARDIPGAAVQPPPAPLLANEGVAMPYFLDLQMMALSNGIERTVAQFQELFEQAGWKLTAVHYPRSRLENTKLIAVPI
ncbi:hypothetical protein NM688_g3204 [Phlebia brevispora]|uniref:Uncharacterized protein n=1 Tax=Phlebia brevispora TaxID=194682 RepID=A0ACC1T6J9_9APHY|nr:hypothetical protein NM688_g3204 [Phlebia brevispora]